MAVSPGGGPPWPGRNPDAALQWPLAAATGSLLLIAHLAAGSIELGRSVPRAGSTPVFGTLQHKGLRRSGVTLFMRLRGREASLRSRCWCGKQQENVGTGARSPWPSDVCRYSLCPRLSFLRQTSPMLAVAISYGVPGTPLAVIDEVVQDLEAFKRIASSRCHRRHAFLLTENVRLRLQAKCCGCCVQYPP